MSKEIPTIKGATYVVTPLTDGTVTAPDGRVVVSFTVGQQVSFAAPGSFVVISDDEAFVDICFNSAAPAGVGGGKTNNTELHAHLIDRLRHLSGDERAFLETVFPSFGEHTVAVPEGALSLGTIRAHFALNAQPGDERNHAAMSAPSTVYVSRVPWARWVGDEETGQWVNNASTVDENVFGVSRKLMDNAGLQHACSTDTVEGVDDYNGKLWPFYWQHANYISDEHGIKHVTSIKGVHEDFDPCTKDVCSFGPSFWFFCCLEHSRKEDGTWNTHDGTENGTPLFQLWGISSRAWQDLDEGRREQLAALGVSEADFHLWPSAQVWDTESEKLVPRSYWCHSAYCGGYEEMEDGTERLSSKSGIPLRNNISHNGLNELYGNRPGMGGSANVNGFGILFDIVKNANKNSQSIHMGMSENICLAVRASHSTAHPDYLFPIAQKGVFEAGCTVCLGQKEVAGYGNGSNEYKRSITNQIGRIKAIETRELLLADGSTASSLCLVMDPSTVEPFVVRSGEDSAACIAAVKALTDEGIYACCFASQGAALAGETDAVIGKHDGARTTLKNGKHSYRVQGTEYMPGLRIVAADTVVLKGDGVTSITYGEVECTPTAGQYIILQAPLSAGRRTGGSLGAYLNGGYVPVGVFAGKTGSILNLQLSSAGITYPLDAGGTGSSSSTGHADLLTSGAPSPAAFIVGGHLSYGTGCGSAYLDVSVPVKSPSWHNAARD